MAGRIHSVVPFDGHGPPPGAAYRDRADERPAAFLVDVFRADKRPACSGERENKSRAVAAESLQLVSSNRGKIVLACRRFACISLGGDL